MAEDADKFKFLIDYQKEQYDNARSRYMRLEEKAVKYFGAITIAISAFVLIIKEKITEIIPPDSCLDWLTLIFLGLTILSMVAAWSFTFRSLKLQNLIRMPFHDGVIDSFKTEKKDSLYISYSRKYSKATALIYEEYDKKLHYVRKCYDDIVISCVFFSITVVLLIIKLWIGG